jgi:hypothetical protein
MEEDMSIAARKHIFLKILRLLLISRHRRRESRGRNPILYIQC